MNAITSAADTPNHCQICLGSLSIYDKEFPILCPSKCSGNVCFNCCSHLVKMRRISPRRGLTIEDNEESDVLTLCPKCQDDISLSIEATFLLRKVMTMQGMTDNTNVPDSELSAAELRFKHSITSQQIEDAKDRLERLKSDIENGKISPRTNSPIRENRRIKRLNNDVNDNGDSNNGSYHPIDKSNIGNNNKSNTQNSSNSDKVASTILQVLSSPILKFIGFDLFNGMQHILSLDEQSFILDLLTSGDVAKLVQGTQILYELKRISQKETIKDKHPSNATTNSIDMEKKNNVNVVYSEAEKRALRMTLSTEEEAKLHLIEEYLDMNPLPRMPKYVVLNANFDVYAKHGKILKFRDDEWDGSMSDAFARVYSANNYDNGSNDHNCYEEQQLSFDSTDYHMKKEEEDGFINNNTYAGKNMASIESRVKNRVLIYAARKQAANVCEIGDVVTHFEGNEFNGTASDLRALIHGLYIEGNNSFSMVLNAEQRTADAIKDFVVELLK